MLVPYERDPERDAQVQELQELSPQERMERYARPAREAEAAMSRQRFDPYAILRELENARTFFVVIGGLARVIQGSDELTEGLDIAPSLSQENLRRLGRALENMNARRVDGQPLDVTDLEPGARAGDRADERRRSRSRSSPSRPAPAATRISESARTASASATVSAPRSPPPATSSA